MPSVVLDASAILAVVNAEPGATAVIEALNDAAVSSVNYAEVLSKLVEKGAGLDMAKSAVRMIGLQIIDFDPDLAERVGELRRHTKHLGLSLADRACLALADRMSAVALTADRKWSGLNIGARVQLIR